MASDVLLLVGSLESAVGPFLERRGYQVARCRPDGVDRAIEQHAPAMVLVDLSVGRAVECVRAAAVHPKSPKVLAMVGRSGRVKDVVKAVQAGALDVLEQPLDPMAVYRAVESLKPKPATIAQAPEAMPATEPVEMPDTLEVDLLVAEEPRTQRALQDLVEAAAAERSVALVSESLVSEQLARRYHAQSPRRDGPFVVVPTTANGHSPSQVLFGTSTSPSAFERARGGVVYVESLRALGPEGQERLIRLMRGLEEADGVRWPPMILGMLETPDLDASVGRELADLLTPLAVVVPRLHARPRDLRPLVNNILQAMAHALDAAGARIEESFERKLHERTYTGGLAELLELMARAAGKDREGNLVLAPRPAGAPEPLRPRAPAGSTAAWQPTRHLGEQEVQPYEFYEAEIFRFALRQTGGCVSRAAELLQVGRATMYRKMRAYSITVPPVAERPMRRNRRSRQGKAEVQEQPPAAR